MCCTCVIWWQLTVIGNEAAYAALMCKVQLLYASLFQWAVISCVISKYTVFQKSDAKIEIAITTTNLIRLKYPLSSFNYRLSGANIANFNKIHLTVFEQQLFKKWNSKTEVSNMEKSHSSSYTIPSVTVCAQSGRHLHRHLHVFLCIPYVLCWCRNVSVHTVCSLLMPDLLSSRPYSVNLPRKSVQCWTRQVLVRKLLQQLSGTVTFTLP